MCGRMRQAAGILSICVNFTVLSFAVAYNNKKVDAIYGSHITFCVQKSTFNSLISQYLEIFGFIQIDLCVSQIRYSSKFIMYSLNKRVFSFLC